MRFCFAFVVGTMLTFTSLASAQERPRITPTAAEIAEWENVNPTFGAQSCRRMLFYTNKHEDWKSDFTAYAHGFLTGAFYNVLFAMSDEKANELIAKLEAAQLSANVSFARLQATCNRHPDDTVDRGLYRVVLNIMQ